MGPILIITYLLAGLLVARIHINRYDLKSHIFASGHAGHVILVLAAIWPMLLLAHGLDRLVPAPQPTGVPRRSNWIHGSSPSPANTCQR